MEYKGGRSRVNDFGSLYPCVQFPPYFDKLNDLRNMGYEIQQFVRFNEIVLGVKPVFSKMMINTNTQQILDIEQQLIERGKRRYGIF